MISEREVKRIANENGWRREKQGGLVFRQMDKQITVNLEKRFIITELKHPRWGWTKLKRVDVDDTIIRLAFHYPRIHTDKGHYIASKKTSPR